MEKALADGAAALRERFAGTVRTVTASEDENSELFWALHGGGGNFGIAIELGFRLHPLPAATLGLLLWRPQQGPEVVRRYRDFVESGAAEGVGGGVLYLTGPPEEFVPEHLVGKLALAIGIVYPGDEQAARAAAAPLLELGPDGEMIVEMPYAELQCALDDPPGYRNFWSAEHLEQFPDEAVELFCARAEDMVVPSPSQHVIFPWGGAVARQADGFPIANRHATWCVHPFGLWESPDDDERGIAWARGVRADMEPFAAGGAYLNFTGQEGADRIVAGFGGDENYRRLAAVKAEYDPDNVFRLNHNIDPAAAG
jgi:FAD/FMN-containing dehydrogenase